VRQTGGVPIYRRVAAVVLALYLAVALFLTLAALPLEVPPPNIVPLATIAWYLTDASPAFAAVQIAGNLLVLAPLGLLGPTAIPWLNRWWLVALVTVLVAGTIELIQFGLLAGRHADVDDVMLNVFGAVLAYALRGVVIARATGEPPRASRG
jgi:glycopeptide antibiotics resistance protein